jgi:DNA polymerase III subunit alpha
MFLIFDTETTGLPLNYNAPIADLNNWPRVVQISWQLHELNGQLVEAKNFIIKPEGYTIPYNAEKVHGISTQRALAEGVELKWMLEEFNKAVVQAQYVAGHNIGFDLNITGAEFLRKQVPTNLNKIKSLDTQMLSTEYCALPGGRGGKYKWPKLEELHQKLFGKKFSEAHNAVADVEATTRCFFKLLQLNVIKAEGVLITDDTMQYLNEIAPQILSSVNRRQTTDDSEKNSSPLPSRKSGTGSSQTPQANPQGGQLNHKSEILNHKSDDVPFVHLHCHSQFSLHPSSATSVADLVRLAKESNSTAVALTDHGNLYGAFEFVNEAAKAGIKPIIGCEFYLCQDRFDKKNKDNGYNQVLLAKNKKGYQNLIKLSSLSFTEGQYYVPRIDKKLLLEYKDDLIATTGSLSGEIPSLILNVGETQAEEAFVWWKELFGDDFYVELNRHGQKEEDYVNKILLEWCEKYNVQYFASNNTYYNTQKESETHDILLCIINSELKETPVGKGRGFRYGFPNNQYYFRSAAEMQQLFSDLPDAITATQQIADKIESYELKRKVLLPKFDIPQGFKDENEYLRHLTYEGAKKRYKEITAEIQSRIDFELDTVTNSGYAGYFLIVQDFTGKAREMGVWVGPGRGSAAGSVVAYCTGITNVDPIKYDLLFERFLNPERVSMPDIDIDFDDRGRSKVMNYVIDKYGSNKVAQIVTYGTMAAKSAIRNTARALNFPLSDSDRLAKSFPDFLALNKYFKKGPLRILVTNPQVLEEAKSSLSPEEFKLASEFRKLSEENSLQGETLRQAALLEGAIRNTGVHACGVIITPEDITNFVPVKSVDNTEISLVTQFDNEVAESAGLLKMDFLGLNTLTIINDALELIKERHDVLINPDDIPLDDEKTYQLFQRGDTIGIFQYESVGMQKHMKNLKPDKFDDLIAMNALYRPGPMAYIDTFINRKHGREPIQYDLPAMEEYLKDTYGVTVYQEQVMLLSQKLAGFTKGKADELRKAMGKKIRSKLDELKPLFIEGCSKNGHETKVAEKIWKDWEAFAEYAFNKSHSTCYAVIAFHTAYLKANYTAEYMSAVLSNNMNDIKQVSFFMEECKHIGLKVLGPDINESQYRFTVNKNGEVRFGLGAIKGVGEGAVESIVNERRKNGIFTSIFDLTSRVDLRQANKKTLEALAHAGAFDCFKDIHRAQYFAEENMSNLIEKAIRYGNMIQENKNSSQVSLFGDATSLAVSLPKIPPCEEWGLLEKLNKEKEVVGIYISEHPLDSFRLTIDYCCNAALSDLKEMEKLKGMELKLAGMVVDYSHNTSKNGKPYGTLIIEDYTDTQKFFLFGDDYVNFRKYFNKGDFLFVKGKVQPRWEKKTENGFAQQAQNKPENLELKIVQIDLLSETLKKVSKGVTLKVAFHEVNPDFVSELTGIIELHPGSFELNVQLLDAFEKQEVKLLSLKYRVDLNKNLQHKIQQLPFVELSLN